MSAIKTHPACTIHEDGMCLPQWLEFKKKKNGHIRKNLTPKIVNPRDVGGECDRRRRRRLVGLEQGKPCEWPLCLPLSRMDTLLLGHPCCSGVMSQGNRKRIFCWKVTDVKVNKGRCAGGGGGGGGGERGREGRGSSSKYDAGRGRDKWDVCSGVVEVTYTHACMDVYVSIHHPPPPPFSSLISFRGRIEQRGQGRGWMSEERGVLCFIEKYS